jgi:hypothetical protein
VLPISHLALNPQFRKTHMEQQKSSHECVDWSFTCEKLAYDKFVPMKKLDRLKMNLMSESTCWNGGPKIRQVTIFSPFLFLGPWVCIFIACDTCVCTHKMCFKRASKGREGHGIVVPCTTRRNFLKVFNWGVAPSQELPNMNKACNWQAIVE